MSSINSDFIKKGEQCLYVIKPNKRTLQNVEALKKYLEVEKQSVLENCLKFGGILFRNFNISSEKDFISIVNFFRESSSLNYVDGNSPRTKLRENVYTSTEYPKEYSISLHNEMSYSKKWPDLIFFFCHTPAAEGGETPIIDSRYLLTVLDPEIVENFRKHRIKYTRYLVGDKGFGKTWSETFECNDKSEVENLLKSMNIDFFWEDNNLAISNIGLGTAVHPKTNDEVWFNQANQFHPSNLPDDICKMLKIMHMENPHRFPHYSCFNDGSEISEKHLKQITRKSFDHAIVFPWQKGDLLMLDNMLMAHGRLPFKGDRRILVSMC